MRRQTQLFSAIAMGAAMALAVPAAGQQDTPAERAEQQQERQAQQQREEQQPGDREAQQSPQQEAPPERPQQREADQNQQNRERSQQTPADPQRARDGQQQQSDRQQRRAMLGVAFAQQGQARREQDGARPGQDGTPQEQEESRQGLEIAAIMPDSAAEQANLQRGDVIVSADGQEIRSAEELDRIIQQRSVGDTLDLVILRSNEQQQMQVTLQAAPEMDSRQGSRRPDFDRGERASRGWLGVTLDTQEQQGQGVTINRVYPAGPAARAGLREGDKIVQVTGQQVSSYEDVLEALGQTRPGDSVDLTVASNGQQQQVSIRLDDAGVFSDAEDDFDSSFMWRDPSGRTAEIPEHDMMLEQHRRFAEQHQRIEELLLEVKRDLEEIKQQMNGQQAQPREDQ